MDLSTKEDLECYFENYWGKKDDALVEKLGEHMDKILGTDAEKDFIVIDITDIDEEGISGDDIPTLCIEFKPKTFSSTDELREFVHQEGFDRVYFFDGSGSDYITAVIGYDANSGRIIYDYNKMVEYLVDGGMVNDDPDYGGPEIDAIEWIDYNTVRSLPYYKPSPIVLYRKEEYEVE
jgi:hypothetical protein